MSPSQPGKRLITARDVTELAGIHRGTLNRWVREGRVQQYLIDGVGRPRYDPEEVLALARGEPPPPPPGRGLRELQERAGQLTLALDDVIGRGEIQAGEVIALRYSLRAVNASLSRLVELERERLPESYAFRRRRRRRVFRPLGLAA
jgi:hypothetical protein